MAIRIPIITDLQDKGIRDAKKAFGDFKTSVNNAEGGLGKFKAGSKSVFDSVKANAGTFAVAGAAAFGAFATKAITAFQDIAIASGKFADATGLAVEDASRYIEVAGDLGIPVDAVEGAIGRLNKTIGADPDKVRDLGVDLVYLNDGSLDVNKTLFNTIERIKGIKDPAEKAKVAAQLLGKGWQSMAELIEMGADDLKASLDSVSGAQVITDEELEKAKEYRETTQQLGDLWNAFVISAGGAFVTIANDTREMFSSWEGLGNQLKQGPLGSAITEISGWFNDNEEKAKAAEDAAKSLGDAYSGYVNSRLADSREEIAQMNIELGDQSDELFIVDEAWKALIGTLQIDRAMMGARDQLDALKETALEAYGGSAEAVAEYEAKLIDAQLMVLRLAEDINLTAAQQTRIQVLVETGEIEKALDLLDRVRTSSGKLGIEEQRFRGARALGGPVMAGGSYLVGERGPELFTPGTSGNITPNNALGGSETINAMGGANITVNVTSANPDDVVAALQRWVRNNGSLALSTTAGVRF